MNMNESMHEVCSYGHIFPQDIVQTSTQMSEWTSERASASRASELVSEWTSERTSNFFYPNVSFRDSLGQLANATAYLWMSWPTCKRLGPLANVMAHSRMSWPTCLRHGPLANVTGNLRISRRTIEDLSNDIIFFFPSWVRHKSSLMLRLILFP